MRAEKPLRHQGRSEVDRAYCRKRMNLKHSRAQISTSVAAELSVAACVHLMKARPPLPVTEATRDPVTATAIHEVSGMTTPMPSSAATMRDRANNRQVRRANRVCAAAATAACNAMEALHRHRYPRSPLEAHQ